MNSIHESLPETPKDLRRICPFLGLADDPETSLAYPAEQNFCHCAVPPAVPRLDHQAERCLTASFTACPVYSAKAKSPLPAEIRLYPGRKRLHIQTPWLGRVAGALLIAVLIFFIGWFGVAGLSKSFSATNLAKTRAAVPLLPTASPFAPLATLAPLRLSSPTPQPSPSETATLTPPILPTQPYSTQPQRVCGRPGGWVTYSVQSGDTLYQLSQAFGVTVAQLQSANCIGTTTILHVGRILYVPPWAMIPVQPTLEQTYPIFTDIPTDTPAEMPTETPAPTIEIPTEPPVPTETPAY